MTSHWDRVRQGEHALAIGPVPPDAEDPPDFVVVRVAGDRSGSTGPLDDARSRILRLLGEANTSWDAAVQSAVAIAATHRALGEVPVHAVEAEFVGACNRLAEATSGRATVLFEGLDRADPATLAALQDIMLRDKWLRLPLVLHFSALPSPGPALELIAAWEHAFGEHRGASSSPEPALAPTDRIMFDLASLPIATLRHLRAANVVGPTFEAELVARVLEVSVADVLEALQAAADMGLPIADRGDALFSIPVEVHHDIETGMLPSLRAHWHRRLAELLVVPSVDPGPRRRVSAPEEAAANAGPAPEVESPAPGDPAAYGELFEAPEATLPMPEPPEPVDEPGLPAQVADRTDPHELEELGGDQVRAARHLVAAGDRGEAAKRYLAAIRQLAQRGDARRALVLADEALDLVQPMVGSPTGSLLRARILTHSGLIRWQGAGLGSQYTLPRALEVLEEAQRSLPSSAPARDRAAISSAIAGVCYDLGDVRSLERALAELTTATRALRSAGDSVGAARTLNDQAAVLLRAGDPVRATHLLGASRRVFERMKREQPDHPVVVEELAETEHLLARLPLKARLRQGKEQDAYSLALGHARAAEAAYRKLDRARPLARVWETMGRLEIRRGRLDDAARRLEAAAELQRRIGDVVGLARTAAAMSDVFAVAKRPLEALALLGESISLNTEKGSPLGLAFNRRAVDVLEAAAEGVPGAQRAELAGALSEIGVRLSEAQGAIGQVSVPGDEIA
jgi:tetratricopeptide (TPR) repeat protein